MKIKEVVMESRVYTAYVLSKKSRRELLSVFEPKFSIVDADHITVKFGVPKDTKKPHSANIQVVGYASDESLEAVVVAVNGRTGRSDGSIYHVTLSYEPDRKPVQSNGLLTKGWESVKPFDLDTTPEILR